MTIVARAIPLVNGYRNRDTKSRPVIAVGGCSGVGKSFFAEELLAECRLQGIQAKILQLDDFLDLDSFEGAIEEIHKGP